VPRDRLRRACGPRGPHFRRHFADGTPVKLEPGDRDRDLRSAFLLLCPAGHEVDLYAPRDLQVLKSGSASEADFQPIVLRSSLAQ